MQEFDYSEFFKTLIFGVENLPTDYKLDEILRKEDIHYGSFYCRFSNNSEDGNFARIGYEFGSTEITKAEFDEALVEACKSYADENRFARINVEWSLRKAGCKV